MIPHNDDGSMEQEARRQFVAKVRREGVNLNGDELLALVDDLWLVQSDEMRDFGTIEVYAEWLRRLGGPQNLRPYVNCLMAGRS